MPYLKKLTPHSGPILPKIDNDLAIYGTPYTFNSGKLSASSVLPSGLSYSVIVDSDGTQILTSEHDSDSTSTDVSLSRPRKRQRLDHLSQEEKVMRRKLKNRVAAQSARDRKKAKMTELEDQVSELESDRLLLSAENIKLRNRNKILEKENLELKQRLGLIDSKNQKEQVSCVARSLSESSQKSRVEEESRSLGHAEGSGPEDSYSLDDAIRLLTSNSETDDLLDILQQCSEDLLQCDLPGSLPEVRESRKEVSDNEVVGPAPKSLEPFKELIHFDHIYYKQDGEVTIQELSNIDSSSPPKSVMSTKESNPTQTHHITTQAESAINIQDVTEIPVVHVLPSEEVMETLETPTIESNSFSLQVIDTKSSYKGCLSPLSDAGYDSSFSASSPVSFGCEGMVDHPWDENFTELFPSLV